ncbi:hypothetical protein Tco_0645625, partial [Tanacetum coccineum]
VCLRTCLEPDEWIKDSGCSKHMTENKSLFSTYKAYDGVADDVKKKDDHTDNDVDAKSKDDKEDGLQYNNFETEGVHFPGSQLIFDKLDVYDFLYALQAWYKGVKLT